MSKSVNPVPEGCPTVSPYLIVEDPMRILSFLEEAFGGTVLQRHVSPPVREPETMPYRDRTGGVEDPGGNQWWIATRVEVVDADELARMRADIDET